VGKLLFAALIAGGVFYGYPLWNEHASTACQAMEKRGLTMVTSNDTPSAMRMGELTMLRKLEPISNGAFAAAEAKAHYPQLPPEIGCATAYWASLLDPRAMQQAQGRLE
jgi:hypothetical protein